MNEKLNAMVKAGFVADGFTGSDEEIEKKYKCFMSKKCNDEKFERIKKMFEYLRDNEDFIEFMGKSEYAKLEESYGNKEKRGQTMVIDFSGMTASEAFEKYRVGVKEVLKKGYTLNDDDTYSKK